MAVLIEPASRPLVRQLIWKDLETFAARNTHYYDPSIMSREEAREYGSMFHDRDRTEVFFRIFRESFDPRSMRELRNQLSAIRDDRRPFVATRLLWAPVSGRRP